MGGWAGFVQGGGSVGLTDAPELQLVAETIDGRQVTGRAHAGSLSRPGFDFPIQGTGDLFVDGRKLTG